MAIEGVVADPGAGGQEFGGDDVSGGSGTVFIPYTKLMSGADGSIELIGGDAANGLDVDVTRVQGTVSVNVTGSSTTLPVSLAGNQAVSLNASTTTLPVSVAGTVGVSLAGSSTTLPVSVAGNVGVTLNSTTTNIGVTLAASLPAGTNALGSIIPQPTTSGGLSIARDIDLDNGSLTVVKASAGQLYGMTIGNLGTVSVFVKFYNATSGTLGTGTPVLTITIPGNSSDDTVITTSFGGMGIAFDTGICVGAGTGVADADNTDPGANIVIANIYYK